MTDEQIESQEPIEEPAIPATIPTEPDTAAGEAGGETEAGAGDAWKEVGAQFQALGAGLATAFSTVWKSDENKRHMKEMRNSLEAMVRELGAVVRESTSSPEAKQVKTDAGKAIDTFKSAGERTVHEVRPKLASALSTTNDEIQKLLSRMRKVETASGAAEEPSAEAAGETETGTGGPAQE